MLRKFKWARKTQVEMRNKSSHLPGCGPQKPRLETLFNLLLEKNRTNTPIVPEASMIQRNVLSRPNWGTHKKSRFGGPPSCRGIKKIPAETMTPRLPVGSVLASTCTVDGLQLHFSAPPAVPRLWLHPRFSGGAFVLPDAQVARILITHWTRLPAVLTGILTRDRPSGPCHVHPHSETTAPD